MSAERGGDRTDQAALREDRALCGRAAARDRAAFAALYERHADGVRRLLLARGAPSDAAWDLMQETFARALRSFDRGHAPDRFDLWIRRIALNVCADLWRAPHLRHEESQDPRTLPERASVDRDLGAGEEMRAALSALEPGLREAVILHIYQDLSVQETATVLRIPEGTAKSRLSRAYRRLAQALAPDVATDRRKRRGARLSERMQRGGNEA